MRKSIPVYYDSEKDSDLLKFIDEERGSVSRSKYILMRMYDISRNKSIPVSNTESKESKNQVTEIEPDNITSDETKREFIGNLGNI